MTITQGIFVVFFAIFWGAVFSVQGRWMMFQPLLQFPHVRHRVVLSLFVVNVAPILFFAWTFFRLKDTVTTSPSAWGCWETAGQISAGVLPAFAIFGFYRLWMGIVEFAPTFFYQTEGEQTPTLKCIDPTIEKLHLDHCFKGWWNLLFAVIYFVVAIVGPYLG